MAFRTVIFWDFPGRSEAKKLHSQPRGPRFDPWSGNLSPHAATKTLRGQINESVNQLQLNKNSDLWYDSINWVFLVDYIIFG